MRTDATQGSAAVATSTTPAAGATGLKTTAASGKTAGLARLKQVCGQFEGLFIAQVLKIMHQSGLHSDFLSGGDGEEVFTEMCYGALGQEIGDAGGLGLARSLLAQLAPGAESTGKQPTAALAPKGTGSTSSAAGTSTAPATPSTDGTPGEERIR